MDFFFKLSNMVGFFFFALDLTGSLSRFGISCTIVLDFVYIDFSPLLDVDEIETVGANVGPKRANFIASRVTITESKLDLIESIV